MEDKQFDNILKNKLSGYLTPKSPDWAAFRVKQRLSDNPSAETRFDAQVLQQVEAYIHPSLPQWDKFVGYRAAIVDSPSTDDFDQQVRDTMDNHLVTTAPQWDKFIAFRAAAESGIATAAFDELVRKTVNNYQVTTTPQWDKFTAFRAAAESGIATAAFDEQVRETLDNYQTTTAPQWDRFVAYKSAMLESEAADTFDNQVRANLENYQVDDMPQWDLFQAYRSQINPEAEFDTQIKDKLDRYTTNTQPQWAQFVDYNEARFDEQLREKVESYETTSAPQWAKFQEKYNANKSIAFDSSITSKVARLKSGYNSEHWLILRARLRKIAALRKELFSYKILESILVLLMLFTFSNFYGYLIADAVDSESIPMAQQSADLKKSTGKSTGTSEDKLEQQETLVLYGNDTDQGDTDNTTDNRSGASSTANATNSVATSPSIATTATTDRKIARANSGTATTLLTDEKQETQIINRDNTISKQIDRASRSAVGLDRLVLNTDLRSILPSLKMLDSDDEVSGITAYIRDLNDRLPRLVDPVKKKTFENKGHWLHLFAAMENNLITTPRNAAEGLDETYRDRYGYKFEALYSRSFGNIEYELGLGYSFMDYEPPFVTDTYIWNRLERQMTFLSTKVEVLSIPLRLKYHFINVGRWTVYGQAGLHNDFIAKMSYEIEDKVIGATGGGSGMPQPSNENIDFYAQPFTTGLFGDAPTFATGNMATRKRNDHLLRSEIGLGAERNLSDNVAAYIRAEYLHTLRNTTLGPLNDEIHKLSFGMGFKLRIK